MSNVTRVSSSAVSTAGQYSPHVSQLSQQAYALQMQSRTLTERLADLNKKHEATLKRVDTLSSDCKKLREDSEKMVVVAGGASGVAAAILVGASSGATGGTLAACGIGGGLLGAGTAVIYNNYGK